VRYLEVRYAPVLNTRGGLEMGAAVGGAAAGPRARRAATPTSRRACSSARFATSRSSWRWTPRAWRRVPPPWRGGFDLAGGEAGNPATRFRAAFEHALTNDLACTCHAGEGAGADSVRDAVHGCHCNRIGHGTRIIEDRSLLDFLNDRRICIECCLTSNVQTHATASFATHPFRHYFDEGLNVVLNTDNRLMSGVTLVDEYANAQAHMGFTLDELCRVALNGFESGFLPFAERRALVARVAGEIAALRGRAAVGAAA
jgi:adenosine deaminase